VHLSVIGALLLVPVVVRAQRAGRCADSTVHFEYQVTSAATWIPDSVSAVRPMRAVENPPNLVRFVVDTLGTPPRVRFSRGLQAIGTSGRTRPCSLTATRAVR
jgi:hypothetical protein